MPYNGYPIVKGKIINSTIKAKCPYCGRVESFPWNKNCSNPTRRMSHCLDLFQDYYYIKADLKGGE